MDTDSIKLQMKYYPVAEKEIETAESELNTIFPGTLKEFYNKVAENKNIVVVTIC